MTSSDLFLYDVYGWDIDNWSRSIRVWDTKLPINLNGIEALELGCAGSGGLSLLLALRGAAVDCTGYDTTTSDVLENSKPIHTKYGCSDQFNYYELDALKLNVENKFDLVCFKSVLGGIARYDDIVSAQLIIDNCYRALKPGGLLLFAENLAGSKIHQYATHKYGNGAKGWSYFSLEQYEKFTKKFRYKHMQTFGFFGCFSRNRKIKKVLSSIDLYLDRILPQEYCYIVAGIFQK